MANQSEISRLNASDEDLDLNLKRWNSTYGIGVRIDPKGGKPVHLLDGETLSLHFESGDVVITYKSNEKSAAADS